MVVFGIAFSMNSSVSNVVVPGSRVPFPQVFHSFLFDIPFLNVASLIFFHFKGDIWLTAKYLAHDLVLKWMLVNVLDDLLVVVLFSIEMVRFRMHLFGDMLKFTRVILWEALGQMQRFFMLFQGT